MGGEQFLTKQHAHFPANEKGSLAQGVFQWLPIARRILFEVVDMDTSA